MSSFSAGYAEDDVVMLRHGAAIDAAARAGVRHVVYTSLVGSGDHLSIAIAHRWTEARLLRAPFHTTILRNGLYAEVPVGLAIATAPAEASDAFIAPWGDGRVSVVAREDLADVAARVASEIQMDLVAGRPNPHSAQTYELAGVTAVGGAEVAAALSSASGTPLTYRPSSLGDTWAALATKGLPAYQIAHAVSIFSNINAGLLNQSATDLPTLLGTAPRAVLPLIVKAAELGS